MILPLLSNVYGLNPLYLDKTSGFASLLNLVTLKAVWFGFAFTAGFLLSAYVVVNVFTTFSNAGLT